MQGFTLIELSIVLVIIGLLVGGILVGKDLIHAAELRSVISDEEKFKAAVNTFRLKYNCIPGDCITATNFFGTDPGGCPQTPANTVPKMATCNGSGTDDFNSYYGSFGLYPEEMFRFWQQLAAANLVAGSYTGAVTSGGVFTENALFGVNIPAAKISGSGWVIHYWSNGDFADSGSTISNMWANKNYFSLIGTPQASGPGWFEPAISPQDAYNIDTKIDDGLPYSGQVIPLQVLYGAIGGGSGQCVTDRTLPTYQYVATSTSIYCSPSFAAGF